jgi:agmatine deiminase
MPAEFEPHAATWIAWPHHAPDWPGKLHAIEFAYVEIARALARGERVHILARDAALRNRARRLLAAAHVPARRIAFHLVPTNRSWTRDFGPIFVRAASARGRRAEIAMTDWKFNAWAKYPNWRLDDAVNARLERILGLRRIVPTIRGRRVVLEGGSIDVNGRGSLLTTEECLLSRKQARNPGLTRAELEAIFREHLGVTNTLWLGRGIAGDDTHGHVDDVARFTDPRTIVAPEEPDRRDPNHAPLKENLRRLERMRDEAGRPLRIATVPMPAPVMYRRQRLPASYLNFYIANGRVLVPTFNDPRDRIALDTLARLFPGREVTGIHAVDLVWGLGTIHCLTQQQPA